MNKIILSLIAFVLLSYQAKSQYNIDYGFAMGTANYLGDIGGKEKEGRPFILDMQWGQTRTNFGAFIRYRFHNKISYKVSLNWVRLQGADSLSQNPARVARNLNFRNDVIENAHTFEYVFFEMHDLGNTRRYLWSFKTYAYTGAGLFYNNPKQFYDYRWVALQPLQTEGAANKYSRIQACVPIGVGAYFTHRNNARIGIDIGWRFAFTDYIDDISSTYASDKDLGNDPLRIAVANRTTPEIIEGLVIPEGQTRPNIESFSAGEKRGNPKNRDSYFVAQISASFFIRGTTKFTNSKYGYVMGSKRSAVRGKF
jgi:hypothetical protein